MAGFLWLVRFFRVVPPVPPLVVGLFAAVATITAASLPLLRSPASDVLLPILILQMFAASSGFMVPARRGYYDLLLTRVGSRLRVLLTHWAASVAPGVISWLIVALVERLVTDAPHIGATSSGTLAAMWMLSSIPWALTVALPRFAGGLGWLVTAVGAAALVPNGQTGLLRAMKSPEPSVLSAAAFLVYPIGFAGHRLSSAELITAAPGIVIALLSVVGACAWLYRADIRLESAQ